MNSRKVLIIDDELDLCHLMKSFIQPLGFKVYTASTWQEGLATIHTVFPEVIFLDNNLPDGFGWDHIHEIQELVPNCQITLMSAFKNASDLDPNPGVHVLEKPISLQKLSKHLSVV